MQARLGRRIGVAERGWSRRRGILRQRLPARRAEARALFDWCAAEWTDVVHEFSSTYPLRVSPADVRILLSQAANVLRNYRGETAGRQERCGIRQEYSRANRMPYVMLESSRVMINSEPSL